SERERPEALAVARRVPEDDLALLVADADVDVVPLPVGLALRHVAVEVLEAAGELARAAVVRPEERERESGREHRQHAERPLAGRAEVNGEERGGVCGEDFAGAHSFLKTWEPPSRIATSTPAVVTPTMMIEITAVSG